MPNSLYALRTISRPFGALLASIMCSRINICVPLYPGASNALHARYSRNGAGSHFTVIPHSRRTPSRADTCVTTPDAAGSSYRREEHTTSPTAHFGFVVMPHLRRKLNAYSPGGTARHQKPEP